MLPARLSLLFLLPGIVLSQRQSSSSQVTVPQPPHPFGLVSDTSGAALFEIKRPTNYKNFHVFKPILPETRARYFMPPDVSTKHSVDVPLSSASKRRPTPIPFPSEDEPPSHFLQPPYEWVHHPPTGSRHKFTVNNLGQSEQVLQQFWSGANGGKPYSTRKKKFEEADGETTVDFGEEKVISHEDLLTKDIQAVFKKRTGNIRKLTKERSIGDYASSQVESSGYSTGSNPLSGWKPHEVLQFEGYDESPSSPRVFPYALSKTVDGSAPKSKVSQAIAELCKPCGSNLDKGKEAEEVEVPPAAPSRIGEIPPSIPAPAAPASSFSLPENTEKEEKPAFITEEMEARPALPAAAREEHFYSKEEAPNVSEVNPGTEKTSIPVSETPAPLLEVTVAAERPPVPLPEAPEVTVTEEKPSVPVSMVPSPLPEATVAPEVPQPTEYQPPAPASASKTPVHSVSSESYSAEHEESVSHVNVPSVSAAPWPAFSSSSITASPSVPEESNSVPELTYPGLNPAGLANSATEAPASPYSAPNSDSSSNAATEVPPVPHPAPSPSRTSISSNEGTHPFEAAEAPDSFGVEPPSQSSSSGIPESSAPSSSVISTETPASNSVGAPLSPPSNSIPAPNFVPTGLSQISSPAHPSPIPSPSVSSYGAPFEEPKSAPEVPAPAPPPESESDLSPPPISGTYGVQVPSPVAPNYQETTSDYSKQSEVVPSSSGSSSSSYSSENSPSGSSSTGISSYGSSESPVSSQGSENEEISAPVPAPSSPYSSGRTSESQESFSGPSSSSSFSSAATSGTSGPSSYNSGEINPAPSASSYSGPAASSHSATYENANIAPSQPSSSSYSGPEPKETYAGPSLPSSGPSEPAPSSSSSYSGQEFPENPALATSGSYINVETPSSSSSSYNSAVPSPTNSYTAPSSGSSSAGGSYSSSEQQPSSSQTYSTSGSAYPNSETERPQAEVKQTPEIAPAVSYVPSSQLPSSYANLEEDHEEQPKATYINTENTGDHTYEVQKGMVKVEPASYSTGQTGENQFQSISGSAQPQTTGFAQMATGYQQPIPQPPRPAINLPLVQQPYQPPLPFQPGPLLPSPSYIQPSSYAQPAPAYVQQAQSYSQQSSCCGGQLFGQQGNICMPINYNACQSQGCGGGGGSCGGGCGGNSCQQQSFCGGCSPSCPSACQSDCGGGGCCQMSSPLCCSAAPVPANPCCNTGLQSCCPPALAGCCTPQNQSCCPQPIQSCCCSQSLCRRRKRSIGHLLGGLCPLTKRV